VVSDSLAAAQTLDAKRGTIDFIFIDGDHSYNACKADIAAWTPFVKRGGVIAFHDFGSRADGVTRAISNRSRSVDLPRSSEWPERSSRFVCSGRTPSVASPLTAFIVKFTPLPVYSGWEFRA